MISQLKHSTLDKLCLSKNTFWWRKALHSILLYLNILSKTFSIPGYYVLIIIKKIFFINNNH
jgi:hypothetical protein